jgi:hypothetical protein
MLRGDCQGFVAEVKPFRGAADLIRELSRRQFRVAVAKTIALRSGGRSDGELRDAGAIAVYEDVNDLLLNLASSPLV